MKEITEYLAMNMEPKGGFVDITSDIRDVAARSGVAAGLCLISVTHIRRARVFVSKSNQEHLNCGYESALSILSECVVMNGDDRRSYERIIDSHYNQAKWSAINAAIPDALAYSCPTTADMYEPLLPASVRPYLDGLDDPSPYHRKVPPRRKVVVAIVEGRLALERQERIFYGGLDGGRPKRVLVQVAGE